MPKTNPLSKALKDKPPAKRDRKTAPVAPAAAAPVQQPSRVGRVMVGGHFAPVVQKELKIIAATEGVTLQNLIGQAFNMLLAKHGRPEIALVEDEKTAAA